MIVELKDGELVESYVNKYDKIIFDIYATWCGPCKMLAVELEKFSKENPNWTIVKVNSDKNVNQIYQYNVNAVPTLIFVTNGEYREKAVGFRPCEEIKKITSKY